MHYFLEIAEKVIYIVLLMGTGIAAKRMKLVTAQGEKDLSLLMVDLVWPALIFSSITTTLTPDDILTNIWLPLLSVLTHFAGLLIGLLACRIAGYSGDRKKVFLFHATMNNFFVMALPFAVFFFPGKGAALLSVANLSSIIFLWTVGAMVIAGEADLRGSLKSLFSPGLLATVAGVFFVMTGLNRYIPRLASDAFAVLGQPTLLFGLMIAGTQIYKLGRKALKFDGWNLLVVLLRNFVIPGVLFFVALLLKGRISTEALVIFMIVSSTPVSVNSITMAFKHKSSPELAAEGVLMTHLVSILSMTGYIFLIKRFLL